MEYVILESAFGNPVPMVRSSRRIKISEKSQKNMLAKGLLKNKDDSKKSAGVVTNNSSLNVSTVPSTEVNHPTLIKKDDVLQGVDLLNSVFSLFPLASFGSRQIRLTDGMYTKVVAHTKVNASNSTGAGNAVVDTPDMNSAVDSSVPINTSEVQLAVDKAFSTLPETEDANKDKHVEIKKASHAKAKVAKYSHPVELPHFVTDENNIFTKDNIKHNEVQDVTTTEKRDVPIVVNDRDDKVRFLFDSSSPVEHDKSKENEVTLPVDEKKGALHPTMKAKDDDIASILAEIEQLKNEDAQVDKDTKLAEERFESSVQSLKDSVQKVENAEKDREEAITRARLIKETLQAGLEEKRNKLKDYETRTELNKAKTAENIETAERTAAGTQELRNSMPKQLVHALSKNA